MGPVAGVWALMHYWGREGYLANAKRLLEIKKSIQNKCNSIDGLYSWKTDGPLIMIGASDFNIELVVGGMEEKGWRLLGVNSPPAIHLTLDIVDEETEQRFLDDLESVCVAIRNGELTTEGLLSYGGVGAEESAPKWLLSAVEIMEQKERGNT